MTNTAKCFAVDNSSLLYLSLVRKDHTNCYRFSITMSEDICPDSLQMAVDRISRRFPSVIAGFVPGFFHYLQVPAKMPPQVLPDPGCLITMTKEEIRSCAYRVYYKDNVISIEAFHALTDGYGAIASLTTLIAEYLRVRYDVYIPVEKTLIDVNDPPAVHEVADSYLEQTDAKPMLVPNQHAYQLPGGVPTAKGIHHSRFYVPTKDLLDGAHRYGVSMTTLLSSVMADSIMDIQYRHLGSGKAKPVRIMVPVDLRKMFPSRTLRNFILYALPTLQPQDRKKSFREKMQNFSQQLHDEIEKARMASIVAYHVKAQHNWFFRHVPLCLKCASLRFVYQFFGEVNSSVTVTNLGNLQLPKQMRPYVKDIEVILTPRRRSPYNCGVISYGDHVSVTVSRFSRHPELENVFFGKLSQILQECR